MALGVLTFLTNVWRSLRAGKVDRRGLVPVREIRRRARTGMPRRRRRRARQVDRDRKIGGIDHWDAETAVDAAQDRTFPAVVDAKAVEPRDARLLEIAEIDRIVHVSERVGLTPAHAHFFHVHQLARHLHLHFSALVGVPIGSAKPFIIRYCRGLER